jgi:hypothetical protein
MRRSGTVSDRTKIRYGAERAKLCRSVINIVRTLRQYYEPDMRLGEMWDLLFVAMFIFVAHAEGRPPTASQLSRYSELPRTTVLRKLAYLQRLGSVERIGKTYCVTGRVNLPEAKLKALMREHAINLQTALKEMEHILDRLRSSETDG